MPLTVEGLRDVARFKSTFTRFATEQAAFAAGEKATRGLVHTFRVLKARDGNGYRVIIVPARGFGLPYYL